MKFNFLQAGWLAGYSALLCSLLLYSVVLLCCPAAAWCVWSGARGGHCKVFLAQHFMQ
jgi:hypothetical protein